MIVSIDGPAGAGKSSVAQEVARRLGFQYVDTGAIYRTLAWFAQRASVAWDDGEALAALATRMEIKFRMVDGVNTVTASLRGEGSGHDVTDLIRTSSISQGSSQVSSHEAVRDALLELQRRFGSSGDSLLEGRDIGTVVFPHADVKLYLTASPRVRAVRRLEQLLARTSDPGSVPSVETIAREIRERDERDANREVAPLKPARDAVVLDTTELGFEEVVERIVGIVEAARGRQGDAEA